MSRPSFIYVTYINSTPERVWQALTDPAFTRKYWVNHRNASAGRWDLSGGTKTMTMLALSTLPATSSRARRHGTSC